MYYDTPSMTPYIRFIKRYRIYILAAYMFFGVLSLVFFKPEFISSDSLMWLDESKEYQKTLSRELSPGYVSRLDIDLDRFDEQSKSDLKQLHTRLSAIPSVSRVDSLFSSHYIYNNTDGSDSSLVQALDINDLNISELKQLVHTLHTPYIPYVDQDLKSFHFYIYSLSPISIDSLPIHFHHKFFSMEDAPIKWTTLFLYSVLILAMLILIFRLIFKNYISIFSSLAVVTFTLIGTFTLIWLMTGVSKVYIALTLMVSGIALVDSLYFYYRWHVSHYKADSERSLLKAVNRNITPALWTTIITLLGLGSLLWVDSAIIRLLSLSIIFASLISYILNITLLPALLSYFSVLHPKVEFGRYGYLFAKNEIHYNKGYLLLFLSVTAIVAAIGAYYMVMKPERLFAQSVNEHILIAKIPYKTIDLETITKLKEFEADLKKSNKGVGEVTSLASVLSLLNHANTGSNICDEQNLMQALFFLELYDLEENYFENGAFTITIHLEHADKIAIMQWLQSYRKLDIFFADYDSLISSAKIDKMVLLGISLLSVLIIIGLIMGRIFRKYNLIWVGFIANAIPIIWFGLFLETVHIPLSLEVLIAMTLSVGLSSDATVHFAFKYFRSRYFGRTQRHSLEVMFFYAGIPVVIGSLMLATIFTLLAFTPIHSLQLIGGFGAILVLLSLLVDLFILPVLLLAIDPFQNPS
ncbi:MAG: hypothetical protein PHW64_08410 [Sulfuricurvum sp.]|nr:hypothetical protein [Sulfuricurvum sp.]